MIDCMNAGGDIVSSGIHFFFCGEGQVNPNRIRLELTIGERAFTFFESFPCTQPDLVREIGGQVSINT